MIEQKSENSPTTTNGAVCTIATMCTREMEIIEREQPQQQSSITLRTLEQSNRIIFYALYSIIMVDIFFV